jgi:cytochrome c
MARITVGHMREPFPASTAETRRDELIQIKADRRVESQVCRVASVHRGAGDVMIINVQLGSPIKERVMTRRARRLIGVAAVLALMGAVGGELASFAGPACAASAPKLSFAQDIVPILRGRCVSCHQPGAEGTEKSGLDLTTYEGLMKGTKHGPMVIPKDPDSSNLMWLLDWRASPELRMPHGTKKLSTCDRNDIRSWIREGALNN